MIYTLIDTLIDTLIIPILIVDNWICEKNIVDAYARHR